MAFAALQTFISAAERGEDIDQPTDSEAGESDIDPELTDFEESDEEERNLTSEREDEESGSGEQRDRARPRADASSSTTDPVDIAWTDVFTPVQVEPCEGTSGVLPDLDEQSEPLDFFELFIPPTLISSFTKETNEYARQQQAAKQKNDPYWSEVVDEDIRKYLYINMMFGIIRLPEMRMYWSEDPCYRQVAVTALMGRQRFQKIHQYFHINRNPPPARGEQGYDPLFKVRPLLDQARSACSAVYYQTCQPQF